MNGRITKPNPVREKSYAFALRTVKLYQYLCATKKELLLSRQVLRSGTSIGANVEEALGGHSKKDFSAKMSIAYKEARETHYWFRLLRDSRILDSKMADSLLLDCEELVRMLGSIQFTLKRTLNS